MIFYWDNTKRKNKFSGRYQGKFSLGHFPWEDPAWADRKDVVDTEYTEPGIWYTQFTGILAGICDQDDEYNILANDIPDHVLQGLREHKLLLVIDNSLEAREPLEQEFRILHDTLNNLQIPHGSVIIITGDYGAEDRYIQTCKSYHIEPHLHFVSWNTLPCLSISHNALHSEDYYPIQTAMADPDAKDYVSLNQTVKEHRLEHVYWLIKNGYHKSGLINASVYRDGQYQDGFMREHPQDYCVYNNTDRYWELLVELHSELPLTADFDMVEQAPNDLEGSLGMYNSELFERSLLSFITESEYPQTGVFITEKTYKVLMAGHPFIMLGNPGTIETLRAQGFRTDLCDIDHSYGSETDHVKRFHLAHEQLENWINTSLADKHRMITRDMHKLRYNRQLLLHLFYPYNKKQVAEGRTEYMNTMHHQELWKCFTFMKTKLEDLYEKNN